MIDMEHLVPVGARELVGLVAVTPGHVLLGEIVVWRKSTIGTAFFSPCELDVVSDGHIA
jgi:hypothetical protein